MLEAIMKIKKLFIPLENTPRLAAGLHHILRTRGLIPRVSSLTGFIFYSVHFFLICILTMNILYSGEGAKDIRWDKERRILSYTLSEESMVKIRVSSENGQVYRTLVNLEKRKAGYNQESWSGKDELGLIDLTSDSTLHFSVDTLSQDKDTLLLVDFPYISNLPQEVLRKAALERGILTVDNRSLSLSVNINDKEKEQLFKGEKEIMVFWDNKLIKSERIDALPRTINLDLTSPLSGRHLLTMNLWSKDRRSAAYKNFFINWRGEDKSVTEENRTSSQGKGLSGKIAYCQQHKGFWQVWTADLEGTSAQPLTDSLEDKRYPDFSPDGEKIAYVTTQGELWIMDNNGKNTRKIDLAVHASYPRWSPDGKKIAFVSYQDLYHGDTEIWDVDFKTLKLNKLTSRPWLQYDPCYSPDAANLLFVDGPELYAQEIRKLNFATGDITQITDNGLYDYDLQPAYSPNGQSIVYTSNEQGNYDIWIMDKFGQDKKNLTKNPSHDYMPKITADGKEIFFFSDRSGSVEVWRMDTNGADSAQITKTNKDKQDLTIYTILQ